MRRIWQWVPWILLTLWIAVIFHFSSQISEVSTDLSRAITNKLIGILEGSPMIGGLQISYANMHFLVRKCAHFTEYAVLGMLCLAVLRRYLRAKKYVWLYAWLTCTAVAVADETFQYFVDGRDAAVRDVTIDSAGAFLGIVVLSVVLALVRSRRQSASKAETEETA